MSDPQAVSKSLGSGGVIETPMPVDAAAAKVATSPMGTDGFETQKPDGRNPQAASRKRLGFIALGAGLLGIVFGGTVEYLVGGALDSTGWFGPTLDTIVEQQSTNFSEIRAKLDALSKATPGSPEAVKIQGELNALVGEQEKLVARTHTEIKTFQDEIAQLRAQALQTRGNASGADFWLLPRESITVGDRGFVFAVIGVRYNGGIIDVNLSGKPQALKPGDFVEFKTETATCKVFYKAAKAREDGRYGFDLVCTPIQK